MQVVHGDLNIDNALVDDEGLITGIIDFGDMSHTALITDLASVVDSLVLDREGDETFRVARLILDGYQRITPLETEEHRLISDAWAARAAAGIGIASWRVSEGLADAEFAERDLEALYPILQNIIDVGFDEAAHANQRRPAPASARRPHPTPGSRTRPGHGAAHVRRATHGRTCFRHVDVRRQRRSLPRRLQQRAFRRACPSAGHGGDRQAVPSRQHPPALPPPVGDRVGRTPDRNHGAGTRHRALRQLRHRSERPRLAHRPPRDRPRWRALHGLRLSRDLGGDRRPRILSLTAAPLRRTPRRSPPMSNAGSPRTPTASRTSIQPSSKPPWLAWRPRAHRRRRSSSTASCRATGCAS